MITSCTKYLSTILCQFSLRVSSRTCPLMSLCEPHKYLQRTTYYPPHPQVPSGAKLIEGVSPDRVFVMCMDAHTSHVVEAVMGEANAVPGLVDAMLQRFFRGRWACVYPCAPVSVLVPVQRCCIRLCAGLCVVRCGAQCCSLLADLAAWIHMWLLCLFYVVELCLCGGYAELCSCGAMFMWW